MTAAAQHKPIDIQPLTAADYAAWLPLWHGYQKFYGVTLSPDVTAATWLRLLDPSEPVHGLAARHGADLAGFTHFLFHRSTWLTTDTCYLQDLYVEPKVRGRGIARTLIEAVYAAADAAGAGQVYWLTHQTNTPARALYDRVARNDGFIAYERFSEAPKP